MTEPRCAWAPSGYAWQEDTGGPVVVEESYWMMGKRGGVVGSFSDQVSDRRFRAAPTTFDSSTNIVPLPAGAAAVVVLVESRSDSGRNAEHLRPFAAEVVVVVFCLHTNHSRP